MEASLRGADRDTVMFGLTINPNIETEWKCQIKSVGNKTAEYFKSVDLFGKCYKPTSDLIIYYFKYYTFACICMRGTAREKKSHVECMGSWSHRWRVCWVGVCLSGCVYAVGVHSVPKKEHTNTFMKTHPIVPHLSPSITVMRPIPIHLTVGITKTQPISCHLCASWAVLSPTPSK